MEKYCRNTWKDVVKSLHSNIYSGLSPEECKKRKNTYGDNSLKLPVAKGGFRSMLKMYFLVQILAIIVLFITKEIIMSFIVFCVFLTNVITKIIHIYRKNSKIGFLQKLNNTTTTVLRENGVNIAKSCDLVKGDIVYFKKGSLIAADLRIIEASNVMVDEKTVTGENFEKNKYESKMSRSISNIGEMNNILFKGSVIKQGEGIGIVVETGNKTELGKILSMIYYSDNNKSSLYDEIEKKVGSSMIYLLIISVLMFFAFMGVNYEHSVQTLSICLFAISIYPINIMMTIISKILKRDLMEKKIDLINVSTLKFINEAELIFLDKIGSITQNNRYVDKIYVNDSIIEANNIQYDDDIVQKRLMDIVLLSNNAIYNIDNDTGKGNISEIAYLRLAAHNNIYKSILNTKHHRLFDIPMDTEEQIYTTVNKYKSGYRASVRGNVDSLLKKCTSIMINEEERPISDDDIEKIKGMHYNLSIEGLYIEAIAYRNFSYAPSESENVESNLVFVGLTGLRNPYIKDIDADLRQIKRRGMIPILFTEDNIIAATTIGKDTGFTSDSSGVISGVELDSLTKEELKNTLERVKVFCKITPELKNKIVGTYIKSNYKIAVCGETLSDLPALSASKVAIGKGNAPKVVKKICDVFIKDNYLKGFVSLFDISRNFIFGIKHNLNYFFSMVLTEIFIGFISLLIDSSNKINFMMILLINMVLFVSMTIITLSSNNKIPRTSKSFVRSLFWIIIMSIMVYISHDDYEICAFFTLALIMIQNYIMQCEKEYKNFIIIGLDIVALIIASFIMILFYDVSISLISIVTIIISLVVSIIFELIMKKWK